MESQNEIFKSLADLEKNLISIGSASEMVKNSISKNNQVFEQLEKYTDILERVNSNFSKVIEDCQILQKKINTNINNSVDRLFNLTDNLQNSLTDLQSSVNKELDKIEKSGNNTIEHFSKKLTELSESSKDDISKITKQCVADNSKFVENAINELSQKQTNVIDDALTKVINSANEISHQKEELNVKFLEISNAILKIGQESKDSFDELSNSLLIKINSEISSLSTKIEEEVTLIRSVQSEIQKEISRISSQNDEINICLGKASLNQKTVDRKLTQTFILNIAVLVAAIVVLLMQFIK